MTLTIDTVLSGDSLEPHLTAPPHDLLLIAASSQSCLVVRLHPGFYLESEILVPGPTE